MNATIDKRSADRAYDAIRVTFTTEQAAHVSRELINWFRDEHADPLDHRLSEDRSPALSDSLAALEDVHMALGELRARSPSLCPPRATVTSPPS